MKIIEILNSGQKTILDNINLLASDYKDVFNKEVCRTCPSSIKLMILELKNHYNMTQFKLKRAIAHYRVKKGENKVIHNNNMSDELAIEFLRVDKERIILFDKYPSNWENLVDGEEETEEQKSARLEAEAEKEAADEGSESREELLKLTMTELREKYPHIKARSKVEFVSELLG